MSRRLLRAPLAAFFTTAMSLAFHPRSAQAQTPVLDLFDGDRVLMRDYRSGVPITVTCTAANFPPPPPSTNKECEIRYNAPGNTCTVYRVYADGVQMGPCTANLDDAIRLTRDFMTTGVCRAPMAPPQCELKYNEPGDACTVYRVYIGGRRASHCTADVANAQAVMVQFRSTGLCH